ncbi:peptidoglycan-recognition protein SC2-like [Mantella aurantiaca]
MIRWLVLLAVFLAAEHAQGCPPIVSRAQWGARKGTCKSRLKTPAPGVIVHHTAGNFCNDRKSCVAQVKVIQNLHQITNKWCDIGYHFLIGEDGTIYEGLGWTFHGMHARNFNKNLGISFIGNFIKRSPNNAALNAAKSLISCAVAKKVIIRDYRLQGHRNVNPTTCPGDKLYNVLKGWPRFKA